MLAEGAIYLGDSADRRACAQPQPIQRMQNAVQLQMFYRLHTTAVLQPTLCARLFVCSPSPLPSCFFIFLFFVLNRLQEPHPVVVSVFSKLAPGRGEHPQVHPRAAESHPRRATRPRSGPGRCAGPGVRLRPHSVRGNPVPQSHVTLQHPWNKARPRQRNAARRNAANSDYRKCAKVRTLVLLAFFYKWRISPHNQEGANTS